MSPERIPVADIPNLGELLRRRERRIIVIMACFAIMLLVGAGCGTYIFVVQNQRISDNKQNSQIAKVRADIAANQARIVKEQAKVADLRSAKILQCLTKARKPAQCLDIAAGRPGRDGGIGRDGRPGRQGLEGQPGQQGIPGKTGATGADGAPGAPGRAPTAAEIEGAVAAYCSTHGDCAGPPGENTAVSPSQVASAVQAYCDSRGQCKGADGKDGKNGADSTVPGPPGPPGADAPAPTQEQVNAAVAAYCAANPAACQAPAPVPPATP